MNQSGEPDAGRADAAASPDAAEVPDAAASPDAAAPPDAADLGPGAPQVTGEASAGTPRPTWTWTVPAGATGFRHRVDGGAWTDDAVATTRYTSTVDLADGAHTIDVEAVDAAGTYGPPGSFTTTIERFARPGYWSGVRRDPHTTPYGHQVVIQCHNCYAKGADEAASLAATLAKVHAAQAAGADAIELDVKVEAGIWRVDHNDDGTSNGARLADVLADAALRAGDQLLVIEVKETAATAADMRGLADLLFAGGYAVDGRPVVLMAFEAVQHGLELMRGAVTDATDPFHAHYLRYHLLVSGTDDMVAFDTKLAQIAADGWDGIGLDHTSRNLFGAIRYAQSLGLGVGVYTITWDAYCAAFRDEVDAITTDYDVASCGAIVEAGSALARLDVSGQDPNAAQVTYQGSSSAQSYTRATSGTNGEPLLYADVVGEDRYGSSLSFDATQSDHLTLHDADNVAGDGYLVAAVVNFDMMTVPEGEAAMLVAKSDLGGFTLELARPTGTPATVLRFGVYVDGAYQYATYDASQLDPSDSYFIVAGYDGNGAVRIWVNGVQGTPSAGVVGGVGTNASPIVIGADPQGATATRFYWDGLVQLVVVQDWTNH